MADMGKSKLTKLVTDVDGVLTTGGHYYSIDGKCFKNFASHDADAIKILEALGIEVVAVTADKRGLDISKARARDLGIKLYYVPEKERLSWFLENCDSGTTAFIGDGLWDVPVLQEALVSFAPADATREAKLAADHTLSTRGGCGVILDVLRVIADTYFPELTFVDSRGMLCLRVKNLPATR